MATCMYCQQDNPSGIHECQHCGMTLPQRQEFDKQRKLRRFAWFVLWLTLFCGLMIVWLGRTPPALPA